MDFSTFSADLFTTDGARICRVFDVERAIALIGNVSLDAVVLKALDGTELWHDRQERSCAAEMPEYAVRLVELRWEGAAEKAAQLAQSIADLGGMLLVHFGREVNRGDRGSVAFCIHGVALKATCASCDAAQATRDADANAHELADATACAEPQARYARCPHGRSELEYCDECEAAAMAAATCKVCCDRGTVDDDGPHDGCKAFAGGGFAYCLCPAGAAARAEDRAYAGEPLDERAVDEDLAGVALYPRELSDDQALARIDRARSRNGRLTIEESIDPAERAGEFRDIQPPTSPIACEHDHKESREFTDGTWIVCSACGAVLFRQGAGMRAAWIAAGRPLMFTSEFRGPRCIACGSPFEPGESWDGKHCRSCYAGELGDEAVTDYAGRGLFTGSDAAEFSPKG